MIFFKYVSHSVAFVFIYFKIVPLAIRNNRIENGRNAYTTVAETPSVIVQMPITTAPIPIQHKDNRNQQHQQFGRMLHDNLLDSPFNSPSDSPKLSPMQSPISQRKLNTGPKDMVQEHYATPSSWLKSLRLHKYSNTLQDYTFEKVAISFLNRTATNEKTYFVFSNYMLF